MRIKVAFAGILLLLTVVLIAQNAAVVKVTFLFWSFQISLVLLIFLILVAGLLIGWVLHSLANHLRKAPPA
jgi:uncharacterized integral membrane protein